MVVKYISEKVTSIKINLSPCRLLKEQYNKIISDISKVIQNNNLLEIFEDGLLWLRQVKISFNKQNYYGFMFFLKRNRYLFVYYKPNILYYRIVITDLSQEIKLTDIPKINLINSKFKIYDTDFKGLKDLVKLIRIYYKINNLI
ncbi:MAG: hypothetical protein MJ211_13185 [Bacteroidales bacterium]|nr:hypothetical protein [Bacteroidales bacterium]